VSLKASEGNIDPLARAPSELRGTKIDGYIEK